MKRILILDRDYVLKYLNSSVFEIICVALSRTRAANLRKEGINVIGCFEEEFDTLPEADITSDYLIHSFDSDRFLTGRSLEERQKILRKEVSFWRRILNDYKPSLIVNEVVTIEFMEVMAIEAQARGIPYKTWGILPFPHQDIWVDGCFNTRMNEGYWDSITPNQEDLEKADVYIREMREKKLKPFYINIKSVSKISHLRYKFNSFIRAYIKHAKKQKSNLFYYEDYKEITLLELKYAYALCVKDYDPFQINVENEYFFFPLHMEPEAAVSYSAYYYDDQAMIISRIAHFLKPNQRLIVKEHPQQKGVLLTSKYQALKKKYNNLLYVNGKISSFDIFNRIKCLITLNGTAGFEALVCGTPVVVIGEVFYKDMPGVTPCNSFVELESYIRNSCYNFPTEEGTRLFVAKIFNKLTNTFPYLKDDKTYEQEDLDNIRLQIEDFINEGAKKCQF